MAIELNLLPDAVRLAQLRARHFRRWAMSSLPLVAGLGVLAAFDAVRSVQAADLRERAAAVSHRVAARRAEVKKLGDELAEATLHLSRSDALRAKRNWSDVLAFIGRHMPSGCWLDSFSTDPDSPPPGKPVAPAANVVGKDAPPPVVTIEAPRKLRLSGHALDSAAPLAFVAKLKESGAFKSVNMERSVLEPDAQRPQFRFEVVCEW